MSTSLFPICTLTPIVSVGGSAILGWLLTLAIIAALVYFVIWLVSKFAGPPNIPDPFRWITAALWAPPARPGPTHLIDGGYWYSTKDEVKPEHGEGLQLFGEFCHESGGIRFSAPEKRTWGTFDTETSEFLFTHNKGTVEYWRPLQTEVELNEERLSQLYP